RRRAGRTFLGLRHTLLEGRPKAGHPQLLAVRLGQRPDDLVVAPVAHAEDASAGDRRGAVATPQSLGLPGERRPVLGPLLEEAFLLGDGVPIGTLPLRPVVGAGWRSGQGALQQGARRLGARRQSARRQSAPCFTAIG